jgi:hypothetical protein
VAAFVSYHNRRSFTMKEIRSSDVSMRSFNMNDDTKIYRIRAHLQSKPIDYVQYSKSYLSDDMFDVCLRLFAC